jgi:hypothetical protein
MTNEALHGQSPRAWGDSPDGADPVFAISEVDLRSMGASGQSWAAAREERE